MQTEKGYKIKPMQTKKQFLKNMLIKFAREEDVSPALFNGEFSAVSEYEKQFICVYADTQVNYTCSIGYDREETYVEMETKQKLVDGKWVKYTEPVNKKRTVTDWQPHTGERTGNCFVALKPDGTVDEDCADCEHNCKGNVSDSDLVLDIEPVVMDKAKEELHSFAQREARWNLPGDRYRDFTGQSKLEVTQTRAYEMPFYQVEYKCNGETDIVDVNACQDFSIALKEHTTEKLAYEPKDTSKIAIEKYKPLFTAFLACAIAFAANIALGSFLTIILGDFGDVLSIILGFAIIPAIVLFVIWCKKTNEYQKELDEIEKRKKANILTEKRQVVFEALSSCLAKYDLGTVEYEEVFKE